MKKTILSSLAGIALVTAAFATQAAGKSDDFEQQLMITDGYYPQYNVVPRHTKPESAFAAAENAQLEKERISDSFGSKPVPFVANVATPSREMQTAQATNRHTAM